MSGIGSLSFNLNVKKSQFIFISLFYCKCNWWMCFVKHIKNFINIFFIFSQNKTIVNISEITFLFIKPTNMWGKVGPSGEPIAIPSFWEDICELNVNCTPLVYNLRNLRKFILLILGVSSMYNVSTHISTTSSSGTLVKKLFTSNEAIIILIESKLFIWSTKGNESFKT